MILCGAADRMSQPFLDETRYWCDSASGIERGVLRFGTHPPSRIRIDPVERQLHLVRHFAGGGFEPTCRLIRCAVRTS